MSSGVSVGGRRGGGGGGGRRREGLQIVRTSSGGQAFVLRLVSAGQFAAVALDAAGDGAVARARAQRTAQRFEPGTLQQLHIVCSAGPGSRPSSLLLSLLLLTITSLW